MIEEDEALRLVEIAVEQAGGPRSIVASPRHPFAMNAEEEHEVEGRIVTIHFSEQSAPAIASVEGWIFEIREHEYLMLQRPRKPRTQ